MINKNLSQASHSFYFFRKVVKIMNAQNNIFNELRMISIADGEEYCSAARLQKAMTIVENMKAYGYVLRAQDVVLLASSKELDSFYTKFTSFIPEVKAKPMYPNFPTQIMDMDEATFRFHQMVHYFSTYGMMELFGVKVEQGWLPDVEDTKKIKEDESLLQCKVVELVLDEAFISEVIKRILSKKERLTLPEKEILEEILTTSAPEVIVDILKNTTIPFKENLMTISYAIVKNSGEFDAALCLKELCQHTGDVFKCLDYFVTREHYKLSKKNQRTFVHVLEMYSTADLMNNVILSNRKAERTKVLLNYINYNRYSTSPAHKEVIRAFRNKELSSWYSQVNNKILEWKNNSSLEEETLDLIAKHPGDYFRQACYLLRLGFSKELVEEKLKQVASALSMEMIVSTINNYCANQDFPKENLECIVQIFRNVLMEKMKCMESSFKGKRIFLDEGNYSFAHSKIELNDKSQEGGYVRSGIAYRIPENVNMLRFFVYWNDSEQEDIDLHAYFQPQSNNNYWEHVGWYGDFKKEGIYFSGDITVPDSAEYIDVDLSNPNLDIVSTKIHSFTRRKFSELDTCFVGMQAVKEFNEEVKLYQPKNCFFYHDLKSNLIELLYGFIFVQERVLYFVGKDEDLNRFNPNVYYSLQMYLNDYLETQGCTLVHDKEEADIIMVLDKAKEEKELSILDSNFFLR